MTGTTTQISGSPAYRKGYSDGSYAFSHRNDPLTREELRGVDPDYAAGYRKGYAEATGSRETETTTPKKAAITVSSFSFDAAALRELLVRVYWKQTAEANLNTWAGCEEAATVTVRWLSEIGPDYHPGGQEDAGTGPGPDPLDGRMLAMAGILREAGNENAADEIEVRAAFVREALRGSDDGSIAENLVTVADYTRELAAIVRRYPSAADEAEQNGEQ